MMNYIRPLNFEDVITIIIIQEPNSSTLVQRWGNAPLSSSV